MLTFEIPRCSRICAATQRELKPGERFFSVLFEDEKGTIRRLDYSQDGWEGLPTDKNIDVIGYWKSRLPDANENKVKLAPNEILLNLFEQLSDQLDKQEMRYVLALLLIRHRILRLEKEETDSAGQKTMLLYSPKREITYTVPILQPDDEQIQEMQKKLETLLYAS